MYEEIGPIYLGDNGDEIFIGRDFATQKGYSEELCAKVDAAISDIIKSADEKAYTILKDRRQILDNLAEILLDMEKISGQQFEDIYNGKTLADFKNENTLDASEETTTEVNDESIEAE